MNVVRRRSGYSFFTALALTPVRQPVVFIKLGIDFDGLLMLS